MLKFFYQMNKRTERKKDSKSIKGNQKNSGVCSNKECKLKKAGCQGSQYCPGYKSP